MGRWFDQDAAIEWIEEALGVLQYSGDEIIVECPECGAPKCWVNIETGQFTCYRCEFGGSLYDLMESADGIERSTARKILGVDKGDRHESADNLNEIFAAPPIAGSSPEAQEEFPQCIPPGVKWYGVDQPSCQAEAMTAIAGLEAMHARGFDNEIITRNRAGWCWVGDYRERVILPVYKNGKVVWWQGWDYGKRFGDMKYRNPNNDDVPYSRQQLVYNIERWTGVSVLVLCEGIFNCWALEQVGYAGICTFGKFLSDEQLIQILNHPAGTILIGLDPDARQYAAELKGVFSSYGKTSSLCSFPGDADFNDLRPEQRVAVLRGAGDPDWLYDA